MTDRIDHLETLKRAGQPLADNSVENLKTLKDAGKPARQQMLQMDQGLEKAVETVKSGIKSMEDIVKIARELGGE